MRRLNETCRGIAAYQYIVTPNIGGGRTAVLAMANGGLNPSDTNLFR